MRKAVLIFVVLLLLTACGGPDSVVFSTVDEASSLAANAEVWSSAPEAWSSVEEASGSSGTESAPGLEGYPSEEEQIEISYGLGQLARKYLTDPADMEAPAIIGEHFTISAGALNRSIEERSLTNSDREAVEAAAKKSLIEKYSLYYQAQEAGAVVTDEYLDRMIEEQITIFAETDDAPYQAFLDGMEMTNEEYWYSCKDNLRMIESISAWKDLKHDAFLKEHEDTPPEELPGLWETYLAELTAEIIEQEHIRYVDEEAA